MVARNITMNKEFRESLNLSWSFYLLRQVLTEWIRVNL